MTSRYDIDYRQSLIEGGRLFNSELNRKDKIEILLEALANKRLGVSELARNVGLPISTVYHVLKDNPQYFTQGFDKLWTLTNVEELNWPFKDFDTLAKIERSKGMLEKVSGMDSPEYLEDLLKLKKVYSEYRKELDRRIRLINQVAKEITRQHFGR